MKPWNFVESKVILRTKEKFKNFRFLFSEKVYFPASKVYVFFFLHFFIIYHSKKGWCFWGWCFEKGWCFVKGWCFENGLCVEGWSFQKRFDVSEKIWCIQALEIFRMGLMFWKLTFSKGCVSWKLIFWKGLRFWWLTSFQRDWCFGGRFFKNFICSSNALVKFLFII